MNARQIAKASTRSRVFLAAHALFDAVGYEATTLRAIADHGGFSTGSIFNNFPSKAALYRELYGHPPITVAMGRELVLAMRALSTMLGDLEGEGVIVDRNGAIDHARGVMEKCCPTP